MCFYHKDSKTVIEFYGDLFHRNPNLFESDFLSYGYNSKHKWEYDKQRENVIRDNFKVNKLDIIWENDFRSNPDKVIEECLEQIGEKYVRRTGNIN